LGNCGGQAGGACGIIRVFLKTKTKIFHERTMEMGTPKPDGGGWREKYLVLTVALVIFSTMIFAAGRFSNLPQPKFQAPLMRNMPAYRQSFAPKYQARQRLSYEEMFKKR